MNFTKLLQVALARAGKHETLAMELDLSPSGLSRRINGEIGWTEKEFNRMLEFTETSISDTSEYRAQIDTLKSAMKILLDGGAQ